MTDERHLTPEEQRIAKEAMALEPFSSNVSGWSKIDKAITAALAPPPPGVAELLAVVDAAKGLNMRFHTSRPSGNYREYSEDANIFAEWDDLDDALVALDRATGEPT